MKKWERDTVPVRKDCPVRYSKFFRCDILLFMKRISIIILIIIVISILLGYWMYIGEENKSINNPYGWKVVNEPSNQEFKDMLNYKFSDGSERLSWIEETKNVWRGWEANGIQVKVFYINWLKTAYGLKTNDESKPNYKIYLESVTEDSWNNYKEDIEYNVNRQGNFNKSEYKSITYYLSEIINTTKPGEVAQSYILFPDKNLGIFMYFYNYQSISKEKAESIIKELIDHIQNLN